jgi:hypothetical protein
MFLLHFSSRGIRWGDWHFFCFFTPCLSTRGIVYMGWNFFLWCTSSLPAKELCYSTTFIDSEFPLAFDSQFKSICFFSTFLFRHFITLICTTHADLTSGHLTYYFFQANTQQLFLKTQFLKMYMPCTTTSHICTLVSLPFPTYIC